jgi:hypothetical protein
MSTRIIYKIRGLKEKEVENSMIVSLALILLRKISWRNQNSKLSKFKGLIFLIKKKYKLDFNYNCLVESIVIKYSLEESELFWLVFIFPLGFSPS